MKNAHTLLGIFILIVFTGAYFSFQKAEAPETLQKDETLTNNIHVMSLTLTSPAFEDEANIPSKFTCDGVNNNPELHITGVPEETQSLVLLVDDPDIPDAIKEQRGIEKFDHWVLYNIPADTKVINEATSVGIEGLSSRGEEGYVGPCPPPEYEPTTHRYYFRLYALSDTLEFPQTPTLDEVRAALEGKILDETQLMGTYSRIVQ